MNRTMIACLTVVVAAFVSFVAWRQNIGGAIGGPISTPKCIWLMATLTVFIVVPACLWRAKSVSPGLRTLFGLVAAGFLARGVIEVPMLHLTRAWRCEYGIAHDLLTLVFVMAGVRRLPTPVAPGDPAGVAFSRILAATLAIEAVMAWLFHRVADPASGVYYAADTETFRDINRFTLMVVLILWPVLFAWFIKAGKVRP